jgi:hypothetical protein
MNSAATIIALAGTAILAARDHIFMVELLTSRGNFGTSVEKNQAADSIHRAGAVGVFSIEVRIKRRKPDAHHMRKSDSYEGGG